MTKKMNIIITMFVLMFISIFSSKVSAQTNDLGIQYSSHVQNIGWQQPVQDGNISGTTGQDLRIEALKISLTNESVVPGVAINYQVHVQNIGWMPLVQANAIAGTTGQALRIEAIRINLTGASNYHVQYQTHVQNIGWMDWVQDGATAGTTGQNLRVEAIRIKIVKDAQQPVPQPAEPTGDINANYQAQVQNVGWMNSVGNMEIAGTTGRNLNLESFKINSDNLPNGASISYQANVENKGWMSEVQNGNIAGTVGESLGIRQIKIKLNSISGYHIQYQVHTSNIGWMDWVQDGAVAGNANYNIQAVRIRIVRDMSQTVAPSLSIASPSDGSVYYDNQTATINGSAIDANGVQEIDVYRNANLLGKANITSVNGAQINYSFSMPMNSFNDGSNGLKVEMIGKDAQILTKSISLNCKVLQPMMYLDEPGGDLLAKDSSLNNLNLRGWAIGSTGIQKVTVSVDGQYKADTTYGASRPDVKNAYPMYQNSDVSGYNYTLDTTGLGNGVHTVTLTAYDKNGKTISWTFKITKIVGVDASNTKYNISLSQMVDKQMQNGEPVTESGNSWVSADRSTVQYYANPNNFFDSYGIYQFLILNYQSGISVDEVNNMLVGKGVLQGHGAAFLQAAQQNNISVFYLVSHALLETGNGTSTLATGMNVNGTVVYNMFGINAFDSNPNYYGSQFAYKQGWTTVDKAILGGTSWISSSYINNSTYGQNTLYKMRWNPANPGTHQYATDVKWAYNQIYNIKKLIDFCTNPILKFDIPTFN
ncbi:glucosaminidase domain-containing protein [Clostridium felsineum]|uniref:Ig-like domain-containing protein n=1 Tax=Clostridium felsineum TaxID=36839 RepID=UPI00214DE500|nr:Ig-like domain-containing protein [Clostridium felsineum]MCR3759863.1 glucosaminidase domain-containing protein [Clostridium felsineum]